jgi:hypothetical protein
MESLVNFGLELRRFVLGLGLKVLMLCHWNFKQGSIFTE